MGTWAHGLLDNDTALDALGDLCSEIRGDIERFGADPDATPALCAAVGVLLQLSDYDFEAYAEQIVAAVAAHAAQIAALPSDARTVMNAVAAGDGKALAERRDAGHAELVDVINERWTQSRFGERQAALFEASAAKGYVQTVADRCVEAIDGEMAREHDWSDICREMGSIGLVAVLLVISPRVLHAETVARWRENARTGIARLREWEDDELAFHERYHANLDRAFALLAR